MYQFEINDPHFLPHIGCRLHFTLNSGDILILTGENGIGKTTLVQRFSHSFDASYVEQTHLDFFYDRKLLQIKEYLLMARGEEISEINFNLLWKSFGLDKKEDRFLSKLSGGENQALKLCFGLSLKRDLFLLDEPSQYLDHSQKQKLSEHILKLSASGKTFLMIEHDLEWLGGRKEIIELGQNDQTLAVKKQWTT